MTAQAVHEENAEDLASKPNAPDADGKNESKAENATRGSTDSKKPKAMRTIQEQAKERTIWR